MKKEQATKAKFNPSPTLRVLFFMRFLTCYQALNFVKKPQCIQVLKISETTNAIFEILQAEAPCVDAHAHDYNWGVLEIVLFLGCFGKF